MLDRLWRVAVAERLCVFQDLADAGLRPVGFVQLCESFEVAALVSDLPADLVDLSSKRIPGGRQGKLVVMTEELRDSKKATESEGLALISTDLSPRMSYLSRHAIERRRGREAPQILPQDELDVDSRDEKCGSVFLLAEEAIDFLPADDELSIYGCRNCHICMYGERHGPLRRSAIWAWAFIG